LTTAQVAVLSTAQIKSLTTAAVANLTTANLNVLTTSQLMGLSTAQIQAMSQVQFGGLKSGAIVYWTGAASTLNGPYSNLGQNGTDATGVIGSTDDTSSGPSGFGSDGSLTVSALAVYTDRTYVTQITPMVLDLNGDGIRTLSVSSGVQFDLAASGEKLQTGWVAGGDGLLVLDRTQDGLINDGSELFGSATVLSNGQKATDGYAALRTLDTNGDGAFARADAGWADLKVWADSNADGVSQPSELKTLDSLGIVQLNLNATASTATDNGNLIGLVSSYVTSDGATHEMADVWFATQKPASAVDTPTADLGPKVSGLAQAITAFKENLVAGVVTAPLNQLPSGGSVAQSLAVSTNVGGIVDVLRQFDANGNLLGDPVGTSASSQGISTGLSSNISNTLDSTKSGLLVTSERIFS
jgi:hypothetical protein